MFIFEKINRYKVAPYLPIGDVLGVFIACINELSQM